MSPEITPNTFLTCTSTSTGSNPIQPPETTIFFISGNPGLIGYYHPFLSLLSKYLTPENENDNGNDQPSFQIYGCSLGGFELNDEKNPSSHERKVQKTQSDDWDLDLDLEDQIRFVQGKLTTLMRISPITTGSKQKVILIGHSVGAYIAMEILRRHREASPGEGRDFDIIGGAMLFPTVIDIAASASGRKLTTLLSIIPRFAAVVGFFARLLTLLLPASILRALVRFVMNDPPSHALDATCSFLRSSGGVRQALHMAADEMRTITSDKWSDDVWGAATAREPLTKLFFYFGGKDHWVADQTRDEIIAVRGRKEGQGPTMLVCEEELPHAFCLKHSDIMARKTAGMIKQIVGWEST
ncbi:hypothetical protein N7499_002051 [Penicillium canescens]|uniref:Lipid droplet-associated hydrolase n=1 Tax=Penicillium canescens TaxID=5083 RepID=A0AAD6I6U1_PENCN|nr:uncharacterized protein N7446_009589 [Penicillium canescens]KAJ6002083.1 hypothetical protein N7522_007310 [Penicillium canescens]KAJ6034834.1 hypothetical protein N7460_009009 [Penicillium canescens]KAJ6046498.1 hypothetical protein N7444_007752 [Penicillium canescens]KAJ6053577.1 hypothetical protein N7446_009589 [Penicillium canescens]KAJ6097677.1 hypothetical protein N7499_002051 [Penicillium canescens]